MKNKKIVKKQQTRILKKQPKKPLKKAKAALSVRLPVQTAIDEQTDVQESETVVRHVEVSDAMATQSRDPVSVHTNLSSIFTMQFIPDLLLHQHAFHRLNSLKPDSVPPHTFLEGWRNYTQTKDLSLLWKSSLDFVEWARLILNTRSPAKTVSEYSQTEMFSEVKDACSDYHLSLIKELESMNALFSSQIKELTEANIALVKGNGIYLEQIEGLNEENSKLKQQNQELIHTQNTLKEENKGFSTRMNALSQEKESLIKDNAENAAQIKGLNHDVAVLQSRLDNVSTTDILKEKHEIKITNLCKTIHQLKAEITSKEATILRLQNEKQQSHLESNSEKKSTDPIEKKEYEYLCKKQQVLIDSLQCELKERASAAPQFLDDEFEKENSKIEQQLQSDLYKNFNLENPLSLAAALQKSATGSDALHTLTRQVTALIKKCKRLKQNNAILEEKLKERRIKARAQEDAWKDEYLCTKTELAAEKEARTDAETTIGTLLNEITGIQEAIKQLWKEKATLLAELIERHGHDMPFSDSDPMNVLCAAKTAIQLLETSLNQNASLSHSLSHSCSQIKEKNNKIACLSVALEETSHKVVQCHSRNEELNKKLKRMANASLFMMDSFK